MLLHGAPIRDFSIFQIHRIHNPHNDRDHARIGVLERLARAIAFAVDQHSIADASLRMYKQTSEVKWANQALSAALEAGRLGPNFPEVHFVLGSVYKSTGKTNEAIAELNTALKLAPNSDEGYRRLGEALRSSDEKASIQAYKKAIEINPYYWYNYNELGTACLRFGRIPEAIEAYKKVIEIAPNVPSGYTNLGAAYFQ